MRIPIRLWGMDRAGKLFEVKAQTVDITPLGAQVEGVYCLITPGSIVGIQRGKSKARFRVQWVGEPGTPMEGRIGIRCIEPGRYIWGIPLVRQLQDVGFEDEGESTPLLGTDPWVVPGQVERQARRDAQLKAAEAPQEAAEAVSPFPKRHTRKGVMSRRMRA